MIKTKCVYDKKEQDDGRWILVMRKWPRGIPKSKIDEWYKELGPSKELLSDWKKKKIDWGEYVKRYLEEISRQERLIKILVEKGMGGDITLVCSEKENKYCHRRLLEASIYFNFGNLMMDLGEYYKETLEIYNKVVELIPNYAKAWNSLGVTLTRVGRNKEAVKCFRKAIELKPNYADAWNNLGTRLRRNKEAIKCFKKAIELKPDCADVWNNLGTRLRRNKEAIKCFKKAIELKPDCASAWNNLGIILGENKEAVECFKKVTKLSPDYTEAWVRQGFLLTVLGKYQESMDSYNRAIELRPDYAEVWSYRGFIYFLRHDYESAMKNFKEARDIASKKKNIRLETFFSAVHCWFSGMEMLSKGLLKNAKEDFLKSANFFQKCDRKLLKHFSGSLFLLAGIVESDLNFKESLSGSLNFLRIGLKKLLQDLNKIDLGRISHPTIRDIVYSKRYYFSALLGALNFKKVDLTLLDKTEKILRELKFERCGQTIGRCKDFIAKIDVWKRRKNIRSIEDIPEKGQIELKNLIQDGVHEMNGILTYQGSQKHSQDAADVLRQIGDKIINRVNESEKKSLEEHKKIKKGVTQILNTVQPKPEVRAKSERVEVLTNKGPKSYDDLVLLKKEEYLIWTDERKAEFLINNKKAKITPTHRRVLIHLLENFNRVVSYKELFLKYAFVRYTKTSDSNNYEKKFSDPTDRNTVHRWRIGIHKETNNLLRSYIKAIPGTGYKISGNFKFCIVYRKEDS